MAAIVEVKYFNTFLLKKVNANITSPSYGDIPVWNGSNGIPADKGGYPSSTNVDVGNNWVIEESRINGGFNNTSVSFGAKAYLVEEEPNSSIRGNSMIYSGIFNSRTGINETNVFSVGDNIIKSLNPSNGSIQKLHAENTNLTIFQELKINKALINKDAIYSAEGSGTAVTQENLVIGQIVPFPGKYGISKDPQSFSFYGTAKYFSDKNNNVILKLVGGQIQEISAANMIDYFRDRLGSDINVAGVPGKIIGGWDIYNKQYVLSTQESGKNEFTFEEGYETLTWDENIKGWTSFFTYKPDHMFSLGNKFYSVKFGSLYEHYSLAGVRNKFYPNDGGSIKPSSITFVFNPNVSRSKNFKTVDYEGSNGWQINSFVSDLTGKNLNYSNNNWVDFQDTSALIYSYVEGTYDSATPANTGTSAIVLPFNYAGFNRKENKYVANLINNSSAASGEIAFGSSMSGIKGFFATVTIATDSVTDVEGEKELFAVGSEYIANNGYQ
tara:strand:- start:2161 stop:3651 length:1491 start_codon:yes stop_codon:yes gene_type:complete